MRAGFHEGVQTVEMQWNLESRDFTMDYGYNFGGIPGPCLPHMNESKDQMNDRDLGRLDILHRQLCAVSSLCPMCVRGPYR